MDDFSAEYMADGFLKSFLIHFIIIGAKSMGQTM